MIVTDRIKFQDKIASPDQVLEGLRKVTGLSDIEYTVTEKGNYILNHRLFPKPVLYLIFEQEDNEIILWTKSPKVNYLKEAALVVIESLGGKYDFKINDLAHRPWEDVKDLYKERWIVDLSDLNEESY